jgi:hypothetical protein
MAKRNISAGARAALLRVLSGRAQYTDAILAGLWLEGYKLVELSGEDKAASQ